MPLIMTHGWSGSVIELLETVGPLTDPTAHGGTPGDAFHLVLPSLPGYGFSGEPTELGWESGRMARAWAELMDRLGYTGYVAQGGDVGAGVTDAMGRQSPEGLLGIHLNVLLAAVALADQLPAQSEQERAAHDALSTFLTDGLAIVLEQSTRPQTIGYSLLDSPVGLAAWMLDHDTDSYYKIARAFVDGEPAGNLTRDNIVDDITLYWLTGTGASAARWYWESARAQAAAGAAGQAPPPVAVPVAFSTFPGEVFPSPHSWVEQVYPNPRTSTRSTAAATSPPGKSPSCSRPRSGRRSRRCASVAPHTRLRGLSHREARCLVLSMRRGIRKWRTGGSPEAVGAAVDGRDSGRLGELDHVGVERLREAVYGTIVMLSVLAVLSERERSAAAAALTVAGTSLRLAFPPIAAAAVQESYWPTAGAM